MKHYVSRAALLALSASLLIPAAQAAGTGYADVPAGAWYAPAAEYCRETGLLSGYADGAFHPDTILNRGQLAQILYNQAGRPSVTGTVSFPDVAENAWCGAAAAWAAESGLLSGLSGGRFAPESPVSRQQLAEVLWRQAGEPEVSGGNGFTDAASIAAHARKAVDWAASAGVMNGLSDGSFRPEEPVTRAQAAAVFFRLGGEETPAPLFSTEDLSAVSAMDVMCAPSGIAAMGGGTVLVTDTYYKRLWQVRGGVSQVYAGGESTQGLYGEPLGGYQDAELLSSAFKCPWAVAPFLDGWAVSDMENNVIRMVRSETVETLNGKTSEQLTVSDMGVVFDRPTGLAADGSGNLYVSDTGGGAVRRIDSKGAVTTAVSGLDEPMGLCWKDGVLYIAETGANRIRKLENGQLTTLAGNGEDAFLDGSALLAAFSGPQGVTAGDDGAVYVADTLNSAIRRIRNGRVETVVARDVSRAESGLTSPSGLLFQEGRLYICDGFARKVFVLELG